MKKIFFIIIALSVCFCIIAPNVDIYGYFVNLAENTPPILSVLDDFLESWNILSNTTSPDFSGGWQETIVSVFYFIYMVLIGLPIDIITWLVNFIIVLFGGVIG